MPDTAPPQLSIAARDPEAEAKLRAFAAEHIGDADTVTIEVVYIGHEQAPDVLTLDRSGVILEARERDA